MVRQYRYIDFQDRKEISTRYLNGDRVADIAAGLGMAYLQYCRGEIEQYVARLGLRMNKKTNIFPLRNGIDFLGFHTYLTESGKIIRKVRRSSKSNAQRKLKKQRGLLDREKISLSDIEQSYGSWRSHAEKGNCYHLIQKTDSLFQNLFKESEKQWPKV